MLAAVGQTQLIRVWQDLFNLYGLHIGQMLLTRADLEDGERYSMPAIPCVPCSITASFPSSTRTTPWPPPRSGGDNDNLSARAAILADADLLILLTDQKGLFTADPRTTRMPSSSKRCRP